MWVAALSAHAANGDTKVSKTITEGFVLPANGHLEVTNKYGQILINNSDNDSIIVKLEIIAFGKDRDAAKKILGRVDYDFEKTNQYLTIETILDRKSGAFKELWNNIGDYSKTLLSKNKLEINYEISVPKSITISLTNKFGDVFIAEREQKVDVRMSHGNLRTNDLNTKSNISLSYGQAHIKHIKDGDFIFKASEIDIKTIARADIQSSSSEISIGQADDLSLDSKNDKSVEITNVAKLNGKMTLSKLKVDDLTKNLNIDLKYSDIRVNHIPFNFSLIRIDGKYSDIDLEFEPNTYMDVDIEVDEDNFTLPITDLKKEYIDEKKGLIRLSGVIGAKNNYKGSLNIDSESGDVNIKLKPQQSVKFN
jgi:hypothetical protein